MQQCQRVVILVLQLLLVHSQVGELLGQVGLVSGQGANLTVTLLQVLSQLIQTGSSRVILTLGCRHRLPQLCHFSLQSCTNGVGGLWTCSAFREAGTRYWSSVTRGSGQAAATRMQGTKGAAAKTPCSQSTTANCHLTSESTVCVWTIMYRVLQGLLSGSAMHGEMT